MADEMFNEAVKALRAGQRMRAKDLLTRLLKTDQANVNYWVYMSATVDTEKEQVFCLQNALKIDPNSVAARRGLVLLGAMKPEEANLPPVTQIEASLVAAPTISNTSNEGGVKGFLSRPRNQMYVLIGVVGLVALVVLIAAASALLPNLFREQRVAVVTSTHTPDEAATESAAMEATQAALTTLTPRAQVSTATPTLAPCSLPPNPNPATPLAVYLCATPQSTQIPFTPDSSTFESFQTLKRAYTNGEWDKILEDRTQILRDSNLKNLPSVHFYFGEAYRHRNQALEAIEAYDQALSLNNRMAAANWGRALANLLIGRRSEFLKNMETALATDPTFAPAYIDRAAYYLAIGSNSLAITDLEAARISAPQNASLLAYLALAYSNEGRGQEAFDVATQAVGLDAGLPLAYYARGRAAYVLQDFAGADRDFSAAYNYLLATTNAPLGQTFQAQIAYHYGLVKVALDDAPTAIALYSQGINIDADFTQLYIDRGQLYLEAEQYPEAFADYNKALNQIFDQPNDPRRGQVFLGVGQAQVGMGKPGDALSNLREATEILPTSYIAFLSYGQALVLAKDPLNALSVLDTALGLAQVDSEIVAVLYFRAEANRALGRLEAAIADLTQAQALAAADNPYGATAQAALTEIGPLPTTTPTPSETPTITLTPAVTTTQVVSPTSGTPRSTGTPPTATSPAGASGTPGTTNVPRPTNTRRPSATPTGAP